MIAIASESCDEIIRDEPRAGDAPAARQARQHHPEAPLSLFRNTGRFLCVLPTLRRSDLSRVAKFRPAQTFGSYAEAISDDMRGSDFEAAPGPVDLGAALRDVAAASRTALAGERAGIMARFAARLAIARLICDPKELAGILRQIKAEKRAALAIASRNATRERQEKRAAVLNGKPTRGAKSRGRGGPKNRHG